ncbi:MAG: hypothetical protein ACYTG1_07530 [Planctomycetota bacterium]
MQGVLHDHGVSAVVTSEDEVHLEMADAESVVHLHLTTDDSETPPRDGARVVRLDREKLAETIDHIVHRLRLHDVLLIPVGKWRRVFDAVAFSLADNEDWQEVDAAATVELNTRDPLLCEPGDFQTLLALIQALMTDGETRDQGLMLLAPSAPVLVEIVPDGAVRISVGNRALADEVAETLPV